ncbi:MAG: ABC transporter ATP-binding protein [Paludibacter sp.]|jgi:iron complex transport system ATP-binding protein|nr:ABC transporter ATP-binding protein [Paludibacter sp.]
MQVLTLKNLSIGYKKQHSACFIQKKLNLQLCQGEMICLIGTNGVGKSTLMKTISGLLPALEGTVLLNDKAIDNLTLSDKSKLLTHVLTEKIDIKNATVFDIVAFGRNPYTNRWGKLSDDDKHKIEESLDLVHLADKQHNLLSELSDGEQQRAMIAKALAQDTAVMLLDEPTSHLDLPNRVEIMLLLHRLAHQTGKAILLSTHELDLALQAADKVWLMTSEGVTCGVPEDLVLNGNFSRAFASKYYFFNTSNGNFSMNYPLQKFVKLNGKNTDLYWTMRALARAGYQVVENAEIAIEISDNAWKIDNQTFYSIEHLLQKLLEIY